MGSKKQVLYFTASWCGPCQKIKPVVKELKETYKSTIDIITIDVDEERDVTSQFSIQSMPTFVFVCGDKEWRRFSGANAEKLRDWVDELDKKK